MAFLLECILSYTHDSRTLLLVTLFAIGLKGYGFVCLYSKHPYSQKTLYLRKILSIGLLCGIIIDSAWVIVLCKILSIVALPAVLAWNWIRFAWLCSFSYGQIISVFIKTIIRKKTTFKSKYYLDLIPGLLISCVYLSYMIIHYKSTCTESLEQNIRTAGLLYGIFVLIIPSMLYAVKTIQNETFPRILAVQIRWTLFAFVMPLVTTELITLCSDYILLERSIYYLISTISTTLLSIAVYLTGKRVSQLRFLNLQNKVMSAPRATFATEMKNISEELNETTSPKELRHIVKTFFKDAFSIPIKRVHFYINNSKDNIHSHPNNPNRHTSIESFIAQQENTVIEQLKQHEILIMDELVFSNFYEHNPVQETFIHFLELINVDLFLPIFKDNTVVAYIIVDRYARKDTLYSNVETDEMVVFSRCIGNVVNILQNKDLEIIADREQAIRQQLYISQQNLQEELYHRHQENNQYRESLLSFFRNSQQREIGIVFYKNRRFSLANHAAQTIINVDLNKYPGHPLARSITRIARDVEKYHMAQSCIVKNAKGKRIVISAVPSLDKSSVIITTHPPEISDLVKKQIDLLKEPQNWDYLLYLETTKAGKLINQLIPGSSESILNFKIELLKTALCKRASLIIAPFDDVIPMAKVLHQANSRDTLHIIKLHEPSTTSHTAIKIFGTNKLICSKNSGPSLLKKLDKVGTLLIENVQYLTLDTQKQLADYMLYGYFKPIHSEEKIVSDVRIICSSSRDLKPMVHEGLFDARLYKVLKQTSVEMLSLDALASDEFQELTENIASLVTKDSDLEPLISLSEYEKTRLTNERPISFARLQHKIRTIVARKSKNGSISYDSTFEETESTDPVVSQALLLGKKALRNEKIMRALWDKFKSQTKIAILLGVNRSSVNRRCSKYNLI